MKTRISSFMSGIVLLLLVCNVLVANNQSLASSERVADLEKRVESLEQQLAEFRQNPFAMAIKKAKPAVVKIETEIDADRIGYGSGVIIDKDNGYILTNYHVIDLGDIFAVYLHNGAQLFMDIEVLGYDRLTDLALLKVDPSDEQLTEIEWGDSDNVQVGEWAIAIGHPLASEEQTQPTVTAGVISATNRVHLYEDPYEFEKYHFPESFDSFLDLGSEEKLRLLKSHFQTELIQTDASINKGNSGGPLVNIDGRLIGINTFIRTPTLPEIFKLLGGEPGSVGIGFAVPARIGKKVVQQIKQHGCVVPPELGMEVKPATVTYLDGELELSRPGVLVSEIDPAGPADTAGIKLGDIITTIANDTIQNQTHFKAITRLLPTDKEIQFVIERNGEDHEVTLLTKKWKEYAAPRWGMKAKQPTLAERTSGYKRHGVIVASIELKPEEKGEIKQGDLIYQIPAEKGEIKQGDLIYQIDDRKIHSLEEFKMAYEAVKTWYPNLTIYFERDGKDFKKDKM